MPYRRHMPAALLLAACLHAQGLTQSCSAPLFPQPGATAIDAVCGAAGKGGAETHQNQAKNNFCPAGPAAPIDIAGLAALQYKVQADKTINFGNRNTHPLSRKPGPATNRSHLVALGEGNQVVFQGYVLIARQERAESVNCGTAVPNDPAYYDIHISLVDSAANKQECSGIVTEMIPHHRPASWTPDNVLLAAGKQLPVRVTGQLMFDSSHSPCTGGAPVPGDPARVSLWEIHPIYKFEVCPSGNCAAAGWMTLEDWINSGAH